MRLVLPKGTAEEFVYYCNNPYDIQSLDTRSVTPYLYRRINFLTENTLHSKTSGLFQMQNTTVFAQI